MPHDPSDRGKADACAALALLSLSQLQPHSSSHPSTRFLANGRSPPICVSLGTTHRRRLLMDADPPVQLPELSDSQPEYKTESYSASRTQSYRQINHASEMGRPPKAAPVTDKVKRDFSVRFRRLCHDRFEGQSQSDLKKVLGVSQVMISKYMSGTGYPSSVKGASLAIAFGCHYEYLMTGRGPKWVPDFDETDHGNHIDMSSLTEEQKEALRRVAATFSPANRQKPS